MRLLDRFRRRPADPDAAFTSHLAAAIRLLIAERDEARAKAAALETENASLRETRDALSVALAQRSAALESALAIERSRIMTYSDRMEGA